MTTKPTSSSRPPPGDAAAGPRFPEFPPRDDMQNPLFLHVPGHQTALYRHWGATPDIIALSEVPLGWSHGQREGILIPDLLVAFGVDRAAIIGQRGYAVLAWGKAPEFVLEVASVSNARNDYTAKRAGYEEYGALEYWRFDPTGGELYPEALAGDRLVAGEYQPITIQRSGEARYWGRSEALQLAVCWENGNLRWYDPEAGQYLRTHDEEAEARIDAEARAEGERRARLAAEAELRQLREQLRRPPEA